MQYFWHGYQSRNFARSDWHTRRRRSSFFAKTKLRKAQPQGKSHFFRNTAIATALALTGAEGVGAAVQENINHEPVSGHTLVQDAMWPATLIGSLFEKAPSVFDNKNDNGVIVDDNIRRIGPDQEGQFNIEPVSTPDAFIFPFPFNPPKGATITYDRRLSEILPGGVDKSGAESRGIKDNIEVNLPKGTFFYAPTNAHLSIFQASEQDNPNLGIDIRFVYYDSNVDTVYVMWFAFDRPIRTLFEISKDFPNLSDTEWKKASEVRQGSQVGDTLEDTTVTLRLMSFEGENVAGMSFVENFVLKSPNFTTDNDSNLPVVVPNRKREVK